MAQRTPLSGMVFWAAPSRQREALDLGSRRCNGLGSLPCSGRARTGGYLGAQYFGAVAVWGCRICSLVRLSTDWDAAPPSVRMGLGSERGHSVERASQQESEWDGRQEEVAAPDESDADLILLCLHLGLRRAMDRAGSSRCCPRTVGGLLLT